MNFIYKHLSCSRALILLSFLVLGNSVSANQFTLHPNSNFTMGGNELVTLGLPVGQCIATNVAQLRVVDSQGSEVPIFVKPLLSWHFKSACPTAIRSVKVQLRADMSSGRQTYSFDFTGRNTEMDISEVAVSEGTEASLTSGKDGVQEPRVIPVVDVNYLADSGLLPSYKPSQNDDFDDYIDHQFETHWKDFSFASATAANWLFDRTTTLYKYAARTGRSDILLEAFRSYNWWYDKLNKTASSSDCLGGFDFGGKRCDQKYTYAEPIKLHLALTGDDSNYDATFVNSIAETAWNTSGYGAQGLRAPYTSTNRAYSERGVGLTLLTQISAYEITGDADVLSRINSGIDNIYNHQNGSNPDGLPVDGSLRHSWLYHEGDDPYLGALAEPVAAGSTSIRLGNVADIELISTGAPMRFYRYEMISQNVIASGSAVNNGDGTWTINLGSAISASLPEGFTVRWNGVDFATVLSDRAFSPWMMENVTDAMWHAYFITDDNVQKQQIEQYFRGAGEAISLYGMAPQSLKTVTRSSLETAYEHTFIDLSDNSRAWQDGCSTTTPVLMYYGSSVAPTPGIYSIVNSNGGTDQHLPETVLTLALAAYFESDSDKSAALNNLITDIREWYTSACRDKTAGRNIPWRAFNWQHRSNAWNTYLWTLGDDYTPPISSTPSLPNAPGLFTANVVSGNADNSSSEAGCEALSVGQFCLELFGNMELSGAALSSSVVSEINARWGAGAPASGLPSDQFSARWTGVVSFSSGTYRITATTDDGMRVWIDNVLVIDQWRDQAENSYQSELYLSGQKEVRVEYYDDCCDSVAQVSWSQL